MYRVRTTVLIALAVFLLHACQSGPPLAQAWQVDIGGQLRRPALISGETLLAAPRDGSVVALVRTNGALRWQFVPPGGIWHESLSSDGNLAFVAGKDGVLYALRLEDGHVLWQRDLQADAPFPMLIAEDGTLYLTTTLMNASLEQVKRGGATLWALDAASGQVRWQFRSPDYIFQTPYRQGERVYVGGTFYREPPVDEGGWMHLYALNAADGSQVWCIETSDGFIKSIYATPERVTYIAYRDFVVGLDASSGEELWRHDTGNWVPALSGQDNVLWFGSANTRVHTWDVRTGNSIWEYNLGGGSFNYLMHVPVPLNQRLYLITQRGDIVALAQQSGDLVWRYGTERSVQTGLSLTPDGWLYVGDEAGMLTAYRILR